MIFQDAYVAGLSATGAFTLCEVGHNAPAHMQAGPKLAWYARVDTPPTGRKESVVVQ